jgi:hypothetical protein
MSYKRNENGSFTAYEVMKFDGTVLEATAETLDNAKAMLKKEKEAWKSYKLDEAGTFLSKGCQDQKGMVYCREDLVDLIKEDNENG